MSEELEDLVADCFAETGLAWGVRVVPMGHSDEIEVWLPKSQCERETERLFRVPTWLLRKHDLM